MHVHIHVAMYEVKTDTLILQNANTWDIGERYMKVLCIFTTLITFEIILQ